ncbi:hypothetical protein DH2020_009727 [Rehmannia glutinosa]|uniref:Uncharacterized protein n=1 Tax=Rehmannia glutinosa TaxID=99300 RepID=A0ABR0X9N1_REHGL
MIPPTLFTPWPSPPPTAAKSPSAASSKNSTTASTSSPSPKTPPPSSPSPRSPSITLTPYEINVPPLPSAPTNLLASSGDFLRLWEVKDSSIECVSTLNNSKTSEYSAPLTSFDWNEVEPRRIGTSSIDTTCTIWDIEKGVAETQLIAHDKEVYDIAWGEAGVFASVSADGSVRIFDLRDKEHSTIIYESPMPDTPLLRLAWNKQDLRYMATILMDSNKIVILDIRSPTMPVAELERHNASVNAISWAPQSCRHICSAGDDGQALLWELPTVAGPNGIDPMLMYSSVLRLISCSARQLVFTADPRKEIAGGALCANRTGEWTVL